MRENQKKINRSPKSKENKKPRSKNRKKLSYSKALMIAMIVICVEIIVYAEVAMWRLRDLSSLYALVGIAASLAASIWAYCEKSKAENTEGGIVYDAALKQDSSQSAPSPSADFDPDKAVG